MNGEGEITVGYYSESRMVKWIEDIIITLTMNDNHHPKHKHLCMQCANFQIVSDAWLLEWRVFPLN